MSAAPNPKAKRYDDPEATQLEFIIMFATLRCSAATLESFAGGLLGVLNRPKAGETARTEHPSPSPPTFSNLAQFVRHANTLYRWLGFRAPLRI